MEQATTPQLSPPEILRAAYQAEAGGQSAYAVQFYRYLVDYHARTPEAAEASRALQRLGQAVGQGSASVAARPLSDALASHSAGRPAHAAQHVATRQSPPVRPGGHDVSRQSKPAQRRSGPRLQRARGYKAGRALSVLVIAAGWLALACGIGLAGLHVAISVGVLKAAAVPAVVRESFPVLAGLLPGGLVLVLLGQVCLAIFRTANATAELAAALYAHAESEAEHD